MKEKRNKQKLICESSCILHKEFGTLPWSNGLLLTILKKEMKIWFVFLLMGLYVK